VSTHTKHIKRVRRSGDEGNVTARVRRIRIGVNRADRTRQKSKDDGLLLSGGDYPLTPPYEISRLSQLIETSNMLKQCVAAMVTNVGLCGWEVVPAHPDIPMDPNEKEELESFVESPNSEESLTTIHAKIVNDKESLGFGFLEVIRDTQRRVSILRHAPAETTRLCPKDTEEVLVEYDVARGPRVSMVREVRTFRKYVQVVGGTYTYFKEFGDPRKMDYRTGRFAKRGSPVAPEYEATELIHYRHLSPDAYGVPRWTNQIPAILGSREAEEVNLRYFEDNTVPPMLLSVAGGRLTAESFRSLKRLIEGRGVGKERQNQILLIEAIPEQENLDSKGTVSLQVDKLTDARPSDALFSAYDEANQAKIRSSFRLPPVAVGLSQDVTFATANVSTFVAESQVYAPERKDYDEKYNKMIVNNRNGLNLKTVKLKSKNPSITNPEILLKALTALNVMGGLTPRSAQIAATAALNTDIERYPEPGEEGYEEWMDKPIALTLRNTTANTHNEQSVKDDEVKKIEDDGDVGAIQPEHGSE
jgi:PBSX family phage portal protein